MKDVSLDKMIDQIVLLIFSNNSYFTFFQVFMFRNIEYVLCYSLVGHFKEENIASCSGDSVKYQVIAYIVSLLPYWWRFLQVGEYIFITTK